MLEVQQSDTIHYREMGYRRRTNRYSNTSKQWNFCFTEKFHSITMDRGTPLNKRTELVSTSRHFNVCTFSFKHTKKRDKVWPFGHWIIDLTSNLGSGIRLLLPLWYLPQETYFSTARRLKIYPPHLVHHRFIIWSASHKIKRFYPHVRPSSPW